MAIESVNAWKTSDGKLHLTEEEALQHEHGPMFEEVRSVLKAHIFHGEFDLLEAVENLLSEFNITRKGN